MWTPEMMKRRRRRGVWNLDRWKQEAIMCLYLKCCFSKFHTHMISSVLQCGPAGITFNESILPVGIGRPECVWMHWQRLLIWGIPAVTERESWCKYLQMNWFKTSLWMLYSAYLLLWTAVQRCRSEPRRLLRWTSSFWISVVQRNASKRVKWASAVV